MMNCIYSRKTKQTFSIIRAGPCISPLNEKICQYLKACFKQKMLEDYENDNKVWGQTSW